MNTKQPAERKHKHILVSVVFKGKLMYGLLPATKIGNHYVVSQEHISAWLDKLGVKRGQTFTIG